ncbi:hypothetical protein LMG28614_00543 [Paraburkholderia ultramafica]|uniref:Uncharacterized protein n=1 Tax=Paraburkholderia ultramafica TaxID=1544867 RepID=A0A6S7BZZ7_9BURK|nr:hypothetical protein LMG28614_00543 [Paraburkholderia ultramafica]
MKERGHGVDRKAFARPDQCVEAGEQRRCIAGGDVEAGEVGGGQAPGGQPFCGGEESCRDEGRGGSLSGCKKGGAYAGLARASLMLAPAWVRSLRVLRQTCAYVPNTC